LPEADVETFRAQIVAVAPELRDAPLTRLAAGWDSAAIEAGGFVFKFPKHHDAEARLRKETAILRLIRAHVDLPVPEMVLHPGPPLLSQHRIIAGNYLLTEDYAKLDTPARNRLAEKLARLHAQLHAIPHESARAAGAEPIVPWLPPDEILSAGRRHLPADLQPLLEATIGAFVAASPDETVYGYFDGHGWNMAFDHPRQELNGVFDFADSGFGARHQDLGYSAFISPDLTRRVVERYRTITGIPVDLDRVLHTHAMLRLWEFAVEAGGEHHDQMLQSVRAWHAETATR
jgi:aminoglycoside phosphotransferase (APT) family kinase protein